MERQKQYLLKLNLVMTTLFLKMIVTKRLKQHLDQPQLSVGTVEVGSWHHVLLTRANQILLKFL